MMIWLLPLLASLTLTRADPKLLGKFAVKDAAYTTLVRRSQGSGYDLYSSSFGVFTSLVSSVEDIGTAIKDFSKISPKTLSTDFKWPNQISVVPEAVLQSSKRFLAVPDGFFVPFKSDGSISLLSLDDQSKYELSAGSGSWFYHMVKWIDMDKDGDLDAVTCRANKPMFGSAKGDLLYFENPADHSLQKPWRPVVLAKGPDVLFGFGHLKVGSRTYEVFGAAQFFDPKIQIIWTENNKQDWTVLNQIKTRTIDTNLGTGKPFDFRFEDINGDGKVEFLVTLNSADNGSVIAYEIPADFRTGNYKRHILATDYAAASGGMGKGAPGAAFTLPTGSKKPSILVSGDDGAMASILTPTSVSDPNDWTYQRNDFLKTGTSTFGGPSVADVDGDGKLELFFPSYEESLIYVYRL